MHLGAAFVVGIAAVLFSLSPAWAQVEFDPDAADDPPEQPAEQPATSDQPTSSGQTGDPLRRRLRARSRARAQRLEVQQSGPDIPADLQPWVAWALHDSPDIVCPDVNGTRTCRWPGTLRLTASKAGGEFTLSVYADRETKFALPGNRDHWPQYVQLDGGSPPVLAHGDAPQILVPPGSHEISGQFLWDDVPEMVAIPADVASVELTLGGNRVARPRVDAEGRLWLRDGASDGIGETEAESVRASIYRKFADGVPLTITTRVRLNVSGRAREVELGKILLAESRPIAVRAQIPVQVALDGETKVYVRPGSHDVEIDAVLQRRSDQVLAPQPAPNFYDPQEVWVWVPNEAVRSVELDGLTAIDPERTSLPAEWSGFTTFLAEPGAGLTLRVTRRGVVESQPNDVHLSRDLWLDLDGDGYTIRDRLTGTLHQGWRLDYQAIGDARLGRVSQAGENLLITNAPGTGLSGVEVRSSQLDLEAEVRVESARSTLAIVGWDHDVQSLAAALHLPPGWLLLGGRGVDTMRGTWLESWTLWDFFFVLMVSIVVGRLFGWPWAGVAILALCLAHGEEDAPEWIWIHLIVTLALLRVLPRGWWRKLVVVYRWGAIVALVLIMAPFVHDQIMVAFHPQVSAARPHTAGITRGWDESTIAQQTVAGGMAPEEPMAVEAEPMELDADRSGAPTGSAMVEQKVLLSKRKKGQYDTWGSDVGVQLQQVDPNAVVQTGPGLPNWSWSTWHLEWTGPVGRDHSVSLWLLSPERQMILGLVRVILLIFLGLLLIAPRDMYWERRRPVPTWWRRLFGTGLPVLLAAGIFTAAQPQPVAAAEVPSEETLAKLRERIDRASRCPEPCVVASTASIAVTGLELEMSADVSAARDTAWTLPGPADVLRIETVLVDGSPTNQLRRVDGLVQVRLGAGNHSVVVVGSLADRNTVTIQFDEATRPRHVAFEADGWTVDGISPTGLPDNSLQLTRTAESQPDDDARAQQTELPPWYRVERRLALGMPWQVHTTVRRDDTTRPQLVKLPLVAGEKVITEGIRMEGAFALVDFARGQDAVTYVGEVPIGPQIDLTAALDQPWTETWTVECSRIWRCTFSALPPVSTSQDGSWQPLWRPWPGESLAIKVEKPVGAKGEPKTVENVRYDVTPGKRLMRANLSFTIRASQGEWQEITLPDGAELQSVTIDGEARSIRPQNGVVRLPVQPGEAQYVLSWQQPWERTTVERVPSVSIGSAAANVETTINLGGDRWLLAVRNDGMPWGPAILFWWSLLLVGIIAVLLGAVPHVPLKWWEWGLLAVGMAQLPVVAMLPVVFWFVVLAWRGREPFESWWRFDALQLFIALLTLMALGALYGAAHTNLVLEIDMQVDGYGSTNEALRWYSDRVVDTLPAPAIVSVPEIVFRVVTFLWALWAVLLIVRAARWGWKSFSTGGWWKFPTPRTSRTRPPEPPPVPRDEDDEDAPSTPPPPPVPRNAQDGQLVHVEIDLGAARRRLRGLGEADTSSLASESEPSSMLGDADTVDLSDAPKDEDLELTTDDVIGALVDDSDVQEELKKAGVDTGENWIRFGDPDSEVVADDAKKGEDE